MSVEKHGELLEENENHDDDNNKGDIDDGNDQSVKETATGTYDKNEKETAGRTCDIKEKEIVKHISDNNEKETVKRTRNKHEKETVRRTCDPCRFEAKDSKAQGFCRTCKEYLCTNCEKFHKKFQTTRLHKIVHGVLMPKPVKKTLLRCENHPNNQVEWFCKDHADVICKECKETRHGICDHVLTLEIFEGRETETKEFDDVLNDLCNIQEQFQNAVKLRQHDVFELNDRKAKCQASISTIRNDFNAILDKLEKEMNNELDAIHEQELKSLSDQIAVSERALASLNSTINSTQGATKTENNLAKFCSVTKAKKKLAEYSSALKEIKQGAYTVTLEVVPKPEVAEIMNPLNSFGKIKVDVVPMTFRNRLQNLRGENMRVVESKVHSVKVSSDDKDHDCEITGATFMDDGCLVLCDKLNQKLKLLDHDFAVKHEHKLAGAPWDVVVVKDSWIVVTVPFVQCLQFVQVDLEDGFHSGRSIKTDRMCWGVAIAGEEILVSCHDNPGDGRIYILDKRGHKKKVLGVEAENSNYVFDLPLYLAVSADKEKLFIADGDIKRTITCISKKTGQIIYDFNTNSFGYSQLSMANVQQNPWSFKILVDDEDHVIAYVGDREMVQVVTDVGERGRPLLTNREQISGPHAMAYREADSTLVIGLWDRIQTFRFKEIDIKT